jgi:hypothetical protein
LKIAIDLGKMLSRRCIALYRFFSWVVELDIMSFLCKIWPPNQYFFCFRLIFHDYAWNLKFCSYSFVETTVKYFGVNFALNLIHRNRDRSVLITFSRVLYFFITCFFIDIIVFWLRYYRFFVATNMFMIYCCEKLCFACNLII